MRHINGRMEWLPLDSELIKFVGSAPMLQGSALALAKLGAYSDSLLGDEITEHAVMGVSRRLSFASGRHCVRFVQKTLGLQQAPLGREGRVPVWPKDWVGSISHSNQVAVAVMSKSVRGIGVDIEHLGRVARKLWPSVFTLEEQSWLAYAPEFCADVMFSAKEAGYKAVFPLQRKFIGFHEAQVELDLPQQQFKIRYLGKHTPNRLLDSGTGHWHRAEDHVLTIFVLD